MIIFFSKNMNFVSNFFAKNRKNSIFREKKNCTENNSSKIAMTYFPDRCPVDEHSFRRFLKYLENRAIFDFFPFFFFFFFFTKLVAPPFFKPRAGNACQAITVYFLFQSPFPLKNKCEFLMQFLKKKNRSMRPTHYAAIFPILLWSASLRRFSTHVPEMHVGR